jgi:hypothetical protein
MSRHAETIIAEVEREKAAIEEYDAGNSIRRVGEGWEIRYGDERGLYYSWKVIPSLQVILSHPYRWLSVAEVQGDPEKKLAGDARLRGEQETDKVAVTAIRRRLEEIEATREETGGSDALDQEQNDLLRRLEEAVKQLQSPIRKAHHALATRIRRFIRELESGTMPRLAAHLRDALRFELPDFAYRPPRGTPSWKF